MFVFPANNWNAARVPVGHRLAFELAALMRVFAGQERLKAPGEAPIRLRSSTTDSIIFIVFIAAIELSSTISSSTKSSSTINTELQFSVPRGFFELLLLLIAASEICAVCCLCLLNRERTHRGGGAFF